jgi:hypothetical protein
MIGAAGSAPSTREQIPKPAAEGLGASLGVVETDWVEGVLPGTNAFLRSPDRLAEFER